MHEEIKARLLHEKQTIVNRLEGQMKFSDDNKNDTGELSHVDNHPADEGTEMFDREKDMAIHHHWKQHLKEIDHALEKIEQGKYGICEKTGKNIPYERLSAQPTARFLVPDEHFNFRRHEYRPVEEEAIIEMGQGDYSNYMDEDATPEDETTGYTEELEGFLSTGISGYKGNEQITVHHNKLYKKYTEDRGENSNQD